MANARMPKIAVRETKCDQMSSNQIPILAFFWGNRDFARRSPDGGPFVFPRVPNSNPYIFSIPCKPGPRLLRLVFRRDLRGNEPAEMSVWCAKWLPDRWRELRRLRRAGGESLPVPGRNECRPYWP